MDQEIRNLIKKEAERQKNLVHLIPSENFTSDEVLMALGSCLTNKYAEGYPGRRYYQGNEFVDQIENLAIERGKKVLGVEHLNVQPYSGSPANSAVQMALLERGDKICGLKLSAGGHLTHGHPKITFSGKFFESVQYDVEADGRIDYDKLEELVLREKPKMIMAGTTAYPYILDFKRFGEIADKVGAWLVADISHIAGLIATGLHPNCFDYADVVMTTTHKTLRGPRGAVIFCQKKYANMIDKAVFPGMQGGPHFNVIFAKGVEIGRAHV